MPTPIAYRCQKRTLGYMLLWKYENDGVNGTYWLALQKWQNVKQLFAY